MSWHTIILLAVLATLASAKECSTIKKTHSKLFCYYSDLKKVDCRCSHVVLPAGSDADLVQRVREQVKGAKLLVTVHEFNQALVDLLKSSKIDGIDVSMRRLDSKNDISDFITTIRDKLNSNLYVAVSVPPSSETLAKYYDFKTLGKQVDALVLQTAFLSADKNVTFHPSRLSGLWDMQNTDSLVDLVSGLGAPLSKVIISAPVQAFHFKLQNAEYSAPGSPALEVKSITRNELCELINNGANWTMERDQDRAGPYIFSNNDWISFEDAISLDIKSKYLRVRGLAGIALRDVSQDLFEEQESSKGCHSAVASVHAALSSKGRAPRAALLQDLEREMVEAAASEHAGVRLSPYRITRVVDVQGNHHVIRQDTRTEFTCTRQGYFVHPLSCGRFYRCVQFDQTSRDADFSVFEFECPAGLVFDERVEVCVWPGSLEKGGPCHGSAEIAPVPKQRFSCPTEPGYYADPENCRWFFACMDHGTAELTPYEFRCPYGLVFDSDHLVCEWPWLVPRCGSGFNYNSEFAYGHPYGASLNHYDALGSLGVIKFGGATGHVNPPIVYSNVGHSGSGSIGHGAILSLQNAGLLRTDRYNSGAGSINYHSTGVTDSSLHGHGGTNLGAGFNIVGVHGEGSFGGRTHQDGSIHLNTLDTNIQYPGEGNTYQGNQVLREGLGHASNAAASSLYQGTAGNTQHIAGANGAGAHYQADLASNINTLLQYQNQHQLPAGPETAGATSSQSFTQYNTQSGQSDAASYYTNTVGEEVASHLRNFGAIQGYQGHNGNAVLDNENAGYQKTIGLGAYSSQGINQYTGAAATGDAQHQSRTEFGAQQESSLDNSANLFSTRQQNAATGATIQYFGNYDRESGNVLANNLDTLDHNANLDYDSRQSYQHGINGNINIVGGGYSAVANSGSDIHVNNNGENYIGVIQSTPSPVSVSTVTSVPIPALKTATGFESYNGGVIANIPELQYKVEGIGLRNSTAGFISFASSTPKVFISESLNKGSQSAGATSAPGITFISTTERPVVVPVFSQRSTFNHGYHTNGAVTTHGIGVSTPTSTVVSTTASPVIDATISSHSNSGSTVSYSTLSSPGVTYVSTTPKPFTASISSNGNTGNAFEYGVQSAGEAVHQGYSTSAPGVAFVSTTPSPVSVSSYSGSTGGTFSYDFSTSSPAVSYHAPSTTVGTTIAKQPLVHVQPSAQPVVTNQVSYISKSVDSLHNGYRYEQPSVRFEERPQIRVTTPVDTSYISHSADIAYDGYRYEKPAVRFEETHPSISVTSPKPTAFVAKSLDTYNTYRYEKPDVRFEGRPQAVSVTTQRPASFVSKSVDTSYSGYRYVQPAVRFEERPQVITVTTPAPFVTSSTFAPVVKETSQSTGYIYETPSVLFEQQPAVKLEQKPVTPIRISESAGYVYNKPVANFEEEPAYSVQRVHPNVISKFSIRKPIEHAVNYHQNIHTNYQSVQPAHVSSYFYQYPTVTKYSYKDVVQQAIKPAVSTIVQPVSYSTHTTPSSTYVSTTVTPTYYYQNPSTTRYNYKDVALKTVQPVISTTVAPATVSYHNYVATPTVTPAMVSSYNYVAPSTERTTTFIKQQSYDYPKPSVVFSEGQSTPDIYVTKEETLTTGYNYEKPAIAFEERATPRPNVVYENRQPVREEPFVKKTAYVVGEHESFGVNPVVATGGTPVVVENYQAPNYHRIHTNTLDTANLYVESTPKPTFISTVSSVIANKLPATEAPTNFYYYDSRLSSSPRTTPILTSTYLPPTKEYLPPTAYTTPAYEPTRVSVTTPVPTKEYLPVTTYTSTPVVKVTTPVPVTTYLPARSRVPVTTQRPSTAYLPTGGSTYTTYLPSSTYSPIRARVTTEVPSTTYLPVRKYTSTTPQITTLSRNYLPVNVGQTTYHNAKTIIKQNDIHPLLSAKLGAQCTCVTNALNSGRRQKIIVIDEDDYDDGRIIENEYDSRKIVDITPSPQGYVRSSIAPIARRPTAFENTEVSEGEILSAVKTGLKLVKQAAREGAEEGTEKVLSRVRETIECNRAGLFRHPSQCNKFYSCRWDCTKNKYTLHVFNCPVHLTFDSTMGACNWPSQGPACMENTLLPNE